MASVPTGHSPLTPIRRPVDPFAAQIPTGEPATSACSSAEIDFARPTLIGTSTCGNSTRLRIGIRATTPGGNSRVGVVGWLIVLLDGACSLLAIRNSVQYISGSMPGSASAGEGFFGAFATMQSMVSTRLAIDAAFCSARRVTFAGSMMPISSMSPYSRVATL